MRPAHWKLALSVYFVRINQSLLRPPSKPYFGPGSGPARPGPCQRRSPPGSLSSILAVIAKLSSMWYPCATVAQGYWDPPSRSAATAPAIAWTVGEMPPRCRPFFFGLSAAIDQVSQKPGRQARPAETETPSHLMNPKNEIVTGRVLQAHSQRSGFDASRRSTTVVAIFPQPGLAQSSSGVPHHGSPYVIIV